MRKELEMANRVRFQKEALIEKMQARLKIMEGEMYQRSNEQVKKEIRLERMNHEIEGKKKEISAITEQ